MRDWSVPHYGRRITWKINRLELSAIIFDMDGLMFDTERIAQLAWYRAAADYGYELTEPIYLGVIGLNSRDVETYFRQSISNIFPFTEIYRRKQQYVDELLTQEGLPLKPGLLELLEFILELSIPNAVASSTTKELVTRNLSRAGLQFDVVVGGDEVKNGKPAPDIFLTAARQLHASPERCLVLEDSDTGIKAAHAAGMIPVMIPDIKPPTEQVRHLAYRILPSLHEVRWLLTQ
jgi:HAD superfamily hydrolase (TIGR01509 family)